MARIVINARELKLAKAIKRSRQSRPQGSQVLKAQSTATSHNKEHIMKASLLVILLLAHSAIAFVPISIGGNARVNKLLSSRRDEIAHEIQDTADSPAHVKTHDDNPWKEVLAVEHNSRKHALKQKVAAIKVENKELDKQVHALENKLETLFAVTEVLYVNEEELQQEVKDLKAERNSLRKMAGRTVILLGKRLLWPVSAVLRLIGVKKTDADKE